MEKILPKNANPAIQAVFVAQVVLNISVNHATTYFITSTIMNVLLALLETMEMTYNMVAFRATRLV